MIKLLMNIILTKLSAFYGNQDPVWLSLWKDDTVINPSKFLTSPIENLIPAL